MFFSSQTPAFSNYLKRSKEERKKPTIWYPCEKIDSYIFNLEPNLLRHQEASQGEACLRGSLSRTRSWCAPATDTLGKNEVMPFIHSEASTLHRHSEAVFFCRVGKATSPHGMKSGCNPRSCSFAGNADLQCDLEASGWHVCPQIFLQAPWNRHGNSPLSRYKVSAPLPKGWGQRQSGWPEMPIPTLAASAINTRVRRDIWQPERIKSKKEGASRTGWVWGQRGKTQAQGQAEAWPRGGRAPREWDSHPLGTQRPLFCGLCVRRQRTAKERPIRLHTPGGPDYYL